MNRSNGIHSLLEILMVSTRLGIRSFGGPIAHLGYFHEEYVRRRNWIDDKEYADLVALCNFLPGPTSSQVGIGIGIIRGGLFGGLLSFIGFTLPSVLVLIMFALYLQGTNIGDAGWIHGLKITAVAVVAYAVVGMAEKLTPDTKRRTIALVTLAVTLLWQTVYTQVVMIVLAGVVGYLLYKNQVEEETATTTLPKMSKSLATGCLAIFFVLLFTLPILHELTQIQAVAIFDSFYRAGSLVFGGGYVVLPLLERELVALGLISTEQFLAGFGATQAVPGPMFTFAAYLGTMIEGWSIGILATIAIFLPGFLLVIGILPFWHQLRQNTKAKGALHGINASVVGLLLAAFYNPIWTNAIVTNVDFVFAAILFSMLMFWRTPIWMVVLTGIIGGGIVGHVM